VRSYIDVIAATREVLEVFLTVRNEVFLISD